MKFTKIVCTIGPATETGAILEKLMRAGMNVARLNFSHGSHASHARLIKNIRAAAKRCGQPIAILQDLQGPRIRIGEIAEQGVEILKGESIVLVPQTMYDPASRIKMLPNHFPQLAQDLQRGQEIYIADGLLELRVVRISGPEIHCTCIIGGVVKSHKGMNLPGANLHVASLTKKDREDVAFGIEHGVDYIALSFVRTAEDVTALRKLIRTHEGVEVKTGIIAKIEREEALHNFEKILTVVDGIMVARGDLGIEIPAQKVPVLQKELIKKCLHARKPVIVATQMMESMMTSRRPTRAEVSDVANAVIDHTDAVMLSGESATGQYPLETVSMMSQTIKETEKSDYDDYVCTFIRHEKDIKEMIAHAVCDIALTRQIKLIVVEANGRMPLLIASHRPEVPIIGFSADPRIRQQCNVMRGVRMYSPQKNIPKFLKSEKLAKAGDTIAFVEENEIEIEVVT
jgi:pyruvate kinase